MTKKTKKLILFTLGTLIALFLIFNFGINSWLKQNLPSYIQRNSDYKVSYKNLDVDLGTGNILATKVNISSKNPNNQNVIGIDGTVDTVAVSRLGIYDALFNKRLNSSDLLLGNPNLKITLAKPIDEKTGRKRSPFLFKNLHINNGNIAVYRHTKQKFISVGDLHLFVQNLQLTEESVEHKLPVVFDRYSIQGNNFYYRPDNVYALTIKKIRTENGLMNVKYFHLIPLINQKSFTHYYPNKNQLFDFASTEMDFQDIVLNKSKLSLSNVNFKNPILKIYTTNAKKQPAKEFNYVVNLDDVKMDKAKVFIYKPDGNRLLDSQELNLDISKFSMDEKTVKGNIPFTYESFKITGKGINYTSKSQTFSVASLALNQRSGDLRGVTVRPIANNLEKAVINMSANRARFTLDEWKLENNKLRLLANQIVFDQINGTISAPANKINKKPDFSGILFPLKVKNISIKNSNIGYSKSGKPLFFNNLNLNIANLEMNEQTIKQGIPFKTGNYNLTTRNFSYKVPFYNLSAGLVKFSKGVLQVNGFKMKPTVSRSEFIHAIPYERDLYDISATQLSAKGSWDFLSENKFMDASNVEISGLQADIFRSKIPKDDPKVKPMYSELLRSIKFPFYIANTNIKNSTVIYEEDTKASEGPGKLTFGNFNMAIKNLNSGKTKDKPTQVPIDISCAFMNSSPMHVKWNFDTANTSDAFSIAGNISNLPAASINPFIEPYLKVRAEGFISDLIFDFNGNKAGLNGKMNMKHQNLKVSVLNKEGDKNKLLSAVANMVVRTNSASYPESVTVDNVKRDATKSFFNLFWQGIQEGLKKTLIGKNVEKTENSVKNTITATKATVDDTKTKLENTKEGVQQTKEKGKKTVTEVKGSLREIFGKKKKAE